MPSKTRYAIIVSSRVHGYKILLPNNPKLYLYLIANEITAFIGWLRGIPKDSYIPVHEKSNTAIAEGKVTNSQGNKLQYVQHYEMLKNSTTMMVCPD